MSMRNKRYFRLSAQQMRRLRFSFPRCRAERDPTTARLRILSDNKGRPLDFFLFPGKKADSRGALVLLRHLPKMKRFPGNKTYDADWLRDDLKDRGMRPCIPPEARSAENPPDTASALIASATASRIASVA
ncbi:hypothetical protein [Paracoccus alcaliphilus]|uniref:hypothetical protein n=1 Tax=Paracoccus alcaliphilus TaxID=34002 RepID=UPI001113FD5F|nr:hypothetical protein JHW40_19750 [Paracoccus alcaliphilus]